MITRFLTGGLLLLLGLVVIYLGDLPFFLWVLFVSLVCTYELLIMSGKNKNKFLAFLVLIIVALILLRLAPFSNEITKNVLAFCKYPLVKILVIGLVMFYIIEVFLKKLFFPKNYFLANIRVIVFITSTFPFIYLLRADSNGLINMFFCCSIIWLSDITAYIAGKFFGKNKLTNLSPKKTIEGSIISFLVSTAYAFIFILYFDLNIVFYFIAAIIINIVAQIGDLHESLTKRYFKIKDSSKILPGHGGIYDRADSTIFVMPLMFYIFN
ncbi:phosphatidate cytidylyltransferase [Candidatus Margulisiibacteriota bacterium]